MEIIAEIVSAGVFAVDSTAGGIGIAAAAILALVRFTYGHERASLWAA